MNMYRRASYNEICRLLLVLCNSRQIGDRSSNQYRLDLLTEISNLWLMQRHRGVIYLNLKCVLSGKIHLWCGMVNDII